MLIMDLPRAYLISLCSSNGVSIQDEYALIGLFEKYLDYRKQCPMLPEDDEDLKYERMVAEKGSKEE